LFAKKYGGKFILRIEDTDKERSTKEFEENILTGLLWLGLQHDEFYRQSERGDIYVDYVKRMIENGSAYISKETPTEPGQRESVVRFKNPNKKITFNDLIRGEVTFDTTELLDFVIARSPEEPLYHLAVVVDDHEMKVTHVIRGDDHISNTPRQILIQEAIGAKRPEYAHLPLIVDSSRAKLSKRKHGAVVWLDTYKEEGYQPEALLNYFSLLGWNPGDDREIFTLDEITQIFDILRVQKGSAVFDVLKLKWINKEHLKRLPLDVVNSEIKNWINKSLRIKNEGVDVDEGRIEKIIPIIFERISVWGEVTQLIDNGEFDYVLRTPKYTARDLTWKGEKDFANTLRHIERVIILLTDIPENDWTADKIKEVVWPYAESEGKGSVLWPIRYALSGMQKSPDPFTLATILGKEETLKRLSAANDILKNEK
jgi:glutamyl-tRNA synthetase